MMLSSGRRALSVGGRWLAWRQYSLLRPAVQAVIQFRCQEAYVHTATVGPRFEHLRKLHSSVGVLGKVIPFLLHDVGEGIETVEIKEWLVKVGDTVAVGNAICEAESDKGAVIIHIPHDGVVKELMYEVEDTATRGEPLLMIELEGEEGEEEESASDSESDTPSTTVATATRSDATPLQQPDKVVTTPAVRRLALEHRVNLGEVRGSGKDGRILKEDILTHIEMKEAPKVSPPPPPTPTHPPTHPPVIPTEDRIEPVKGVKAVMAETMTTSGHIPQFGLSDEVDMSNLVQLRSLIKDQLQERGIRFSYMPLIIKAVSMALHHYPILNSHTDPDCTTITYKADHNIGVAMDTPKGLLVPKVKQCQHKSVFEIAAELNRLHELGLKNQLSPSDLAAGTFSLSNIGAIGGTYTSPLLLPPEVAIGALGRIQVLPRFDSEGNLKKTHVICVSWSADHRVIDGATVTRFSNLWKSYLENPGTMLIDLK